MFQSWPAGGAAAVSAIHSYDNMTVTTTTSIRTTARTTTFTPTTAATTRPTSTITASTTSSSTPPAATSITTTGSYWDHYYYSQYCGNTSNWWQQSHRGALYGDDNNCRDHVCEAMLLSVCPPCSLTADLSVKQRLGKAECCGSSLAAVVLDPNSRFFSCRLGEKCEICSISLCVCVLGGGMITKESRSSCIMWSAAFVTAASHLLKLLIHEM